MPLVYQQNINGDAKIGVWHITEPEDFFLRAYTPSLQINNPQKRIQHLAGRNLLKFLHPIISLQDILITAKGMPYLQDDSCFFSISHCDEYVSVVVSKKSKVGIDIEAVKTKIEAIKDKFLTFEELGVLSLLDKDSLFQYTIGWTIKEAMYKWYGAGNVDFKKNLIIKSFKKNDEGYLFDVVFFNETINQSLQIKTILIDGKVLSWVEDAAS